MVKTGSLVILPLFIYMCLVEGSGKIHISSVKKCDPEANYSVIVTNFNVLEEGGVIYVSGSLMSHRDLSSPLHADITAKRYVDYWGIDVWLPVPCIEMLGSCTYGDLCHYGIPKNQSCPSKFIKDDVPCRCPILQGNYTLKPEQKIELGTVPEKLFVILPTHSKPISTPATGKYYVQASARDKLGLLACYDVYFSYNDEITRENDILTNEIWPFVEPLVQLVP